MHSVGVVGAGTMGAGIAHVAAAAGFETFLYDLSTEALESGLAKVSRGIQKSVEKGKIPAGAAPEILGRIHTRNTLEELGECGIVVEAVIEEPAIKKEIFRRLSGAVRPETILATNTSSLSVTALAAGIPHPGRVLGLHFFNPPVVMKLVEVVRCEETSADAVERAVKFTTALGKTPVIVRDTPGFIVNRIARPFYGEALKLLDEGVTTVETIDRIVKLEGGFRMGPFELMDLIGIDVNLAVTKSVFDQTFGEPRFRPHRIQQDMVNAGRLGRKTGRGFYDYTS